MLRGVRLALAACALAAFSAGPVSAELVYLKSGRTLSVRSHRVDGESIVLTFRAGGEMTCDRALVDKIEPDEIPYPEPQVGRCGRPARRSSSRPCRMAS